MGVSHAVSKSSMMPSASGASSLPSRHTLVTTWYVPPSSTCICSCTACLPPTVTRVQKAHSVVPSSSHVSGTTIFAS